MKLTATIARSLQADIQAELSDLEQAVAGGTRDAGRGLKTELRRQVASAGLGQRLANSWGDRHYPNQRLDPASLVCTRAPAHHPRVRRRCCDPEPAGALSRDPDRERAEEGTDGRRISPSTFPEHRFGPLRFVPRPSGASLLVVDGLRASFSRKTGGLRGFRRATERARQSGQGVTTVVMFLLVPQVKLPKRLARCLRRRHHHRRSRRRAHMQDAAPHWHAWRRRRGRRSRQPLLHNATAGGFAA